MNFHLMLVALVQLLAKELQIMNDKQDNAILD